MSNPIYIKRSLVTAAPVTLANGELAYTANGDVLFVGSNGAVVAVGGHRNPGVLTANQSLVANATGYLDVLKTANLYIGSFTVNTINATSDATHLGLAANNELTTTWAVKTYVDAKVAAASGTPGGSNTYVQFNDSGAFGGLAGLTFDKTSNTVTVGGGATINSTAFSGTANNASYLGAVAAASYARLDLNNSFTGNNTFGGTNTVFNSNVAMGKLSVTDVTVSGNLTVTGTLVTVDATNLQVKDSMVKLADQQTSADALSIGVYGTWGNATNTVYTGWFRDQADSGVFKFFRTEKEPTTTVDTTNVTYAAATLQTYVKSGGAGLTGLIANSSVVNITANSTMSVALVANSLSLSTALPVTSGGIGTGTVATSDLLVGNATNTLSRLAVGTDGYVLQVSGTSVVYGVLDGGTFIEDPSVLASLEVSSSDWWLDDVWSPKIRV